jgi:septum site-determining protein MinC
MSKIPAPGALEIKIATVVAVAANLYDHDLDVIEAALRDMTSGDAGFFDREFAVIDVRAIAAAAQAIDWQVLINIFRKYGLNPVAVRNAPLAAQDTIVAHGLSLDNSANRPRIAPPTVPTLSSAPSPVALPPPSPPAPLQNAPPAASGLAMLLDMPVRAGQRVYARGTDLIVTAAVNNGAELIADGSIHVYAPLRGRALAGASGNSDARIFALSMEAELVSIAGVYRTFDSGYPEGVAQRAVQIRLAGDRLDILGLQMAVRS